MDELEDLVASVGVIVAAVLAALSVVGLLICALIVAHELGGWLYTLTH